MHILDKITTRKREEVAARKAVKTISDLEKTTGFARKPYSLASALKDANGVGIISEFKRQSPSKGLIREQSDVAAITTAYQQAGAAAVSVLTDVDFFGGSDQDLVTAREHLHIPILRKDFTVDEYQVIEAKSIGADAILLIGECLSKKEVKHLAHMAKSLDLSVLFELHSEAELDKLCPDIDIVGVNNRDLKTFQVDIETSVRLYEQIPSNFVRISESGIDDPVSVVRLLGVGFQGFLIGEHFMRQTEPGESLQAFIQAVKPSIV